MLIEEGDRALPGKVGCGYIVAGSRVVVEAMLGAGVEKSLVVDHSIF
jgi:hypothetical protein